MLKEKLNQISKLDQKAMLDCQARLDSLTKPPGSLGKLEEIAIQLAGITGDVFFKVDNKQLILMAGDHGVVEEGISAFPQAVTGQMVQNFINGGAAINVLAKQACTEIKLVDIGMAQEMTDPQLAAYNVKRGTNNFTKGPAMTKKEAIKALEIGIEIAEQAKANGKNLIATGEMGIGNTTASSALLAAFSNISVEAAVGRGTGVDDLGLQRKIEVIKTAIATNKPNINDPIDVLAKLGGLEIAGLAGVIIGAAANRIPVIIDGFIASVAALTAVKIAPIVKNFILASHASVEPGHQEALKVIGLEPILLMNMRLGEGTGAVLAIHLIEAAARIVKEMATFASAGISK